MHTNTSCVTYIFFFVFQNGWCLMQTVTAQRGRTKLVTIETYQPLDSLYFRLPGILYVQDQGALRKHFKAMNAHGEGVKERIDSLSTRGVEPLTLVQGKQDWHYVRKGYTTSTRSSSALHFHPSTSTTMVIGSREKDFPFFETRDNAAHYPAPSTSSGSRTESTS